MNKNKVVSDGEARQPYQYEYRRIRQAKGWKFIGYLMPPECAEDLKEWFRNYKQQHKELFKFDERND